MGGKRSEACGRCAMSSVVDVANADEDEGAGEEAGARDPFAGERIEVDESEMRLVSPAAWLGGLRRRLDDLATRLTYGR